MADQDQGATAQSIPALLALNVERYGSRPAYREKEFGI